MHTLLMIISKPLNIRALIFACRLIYRLYLTHSDTKCDANKHLPGSWTIYLLTQYSDRTFCVTGHCQWWSTPSIADIEQILNISDLID